MDVCEKACRFDFVDKNQTVIRCLECGEKEILRPQERQQRLAELVRTARWAGPALQLPPQKERAESPRPAAPQPEAARPGAAQAEAPRPEAARAAPPRAEQPMNPQAVVPVEVRYQSFDGQQVDLSVKIFQRMLCREASEDQARYALGWCAHNKIDPYSGEAYFSVISGQLVIQVSKDAWFKRVEANSRFLGHDGGIIVEVALQRIKESILGGLDDYLIAPELRQKLMADFVEGKALEPKGIAARLRVKKRGIFLHTDETLLGGWATVTVKDRPAPYRFEIDKEGWQTTGAGNQPNVFWKRFGPWMAHKSALKNACRLAFPDLSGLMSRPEAPEEFDAAAAADYEIDTPRLQRKLFALGKEIPPPLGPLRYPELHNLATASFDGRGISELAAEELNELVIVVESARHGDESSLATIAAALATGQPEEAEEHPASSAAEPAETVITDPPADPPLADFQHTAIFGSLRS